MKAVSILAAAILARLVMLLFVEPSVGGDGELYLTSASNGWAALFDEYRPPLYPLTISPLLALGGVSLVYAFQSALTIAVALYASRTTFAGALLIAISPFSIIYEYTILAETLTIGLLTASWLVLSHPGARRAAIAGLFIGLASLARETVIALPLFALPFGYWLKRTKDFAIVAAVSLLTFLPWAMQSSGGEGRFGYNLWVGTWERNDDWYRNGIFKPDYPSTAFTSPEQRAALKVGAPDRLFKEAAIDRITTDPVFVISNWATRYPKLWIGTRTEQAALRLERDSLAWTAFKSAMWGLNLVLLSVGVWALFRRPYYAIPVVYTALIYVPFHNVETRYSLAALPFILLAIGFWVRQLLPQTITATFHKAEAR